jgi:hypothetical protein
MCTDIRLLASLKEIEEPFEIEQTGINFSQFKGVNFFFKFILNRIECNAI